jgi:hypothetical protein
MNNSVTFDITLVYQEIPQKGKDRYNPLYKDIWRKKKGE